MREIAKVAVPVVAEVIVISLVIACFAVWALIVGG